VKLLIIVVLIFTGCKGTPLPLQVKLVKDPETVYEYFRRAIQQGEYHKAYFTLSPETQRLFTFTEFHLAFANFHTLRRIVTRSVLHGKRYSSDRKELIIQICNPEAGFIREFKVKQGPLYWVIDLSRQELNELIRLAQNWYKVQLEVWDGRKYILPPWWRFKPMKLIECKGVHKS
jgi:hypothetical protein